MIIITIETDNYNGLKCNHNDGNDKKMLIVISKRNNNYQFST